MPEPRLGAVPFTEAIDYFRTKINLPTESWADLQEDAHARAFVVAGATKTDMLDDFRTSIDDALANGATLNDFRKDFDSIVEKHGWSYKGKRGWRTRVMFDTNIRTAHAAGRWNQIQRLKAKRPWLIYQTAGDERVRPLHQAWDRTVLPADDAWWDTHYPPNGWGCRCIVRTASDRSLKREGLSPAKRAPKRNYTERVNTSTGELLPPTPEGIDTGWGYNVGKAAQVGPAQAFGQRVMTAPRDMRPDMLKHADQYLRLAEPGFKRWAKTALEYKEVHNEVRPVGFLPFVVLDTLVDDLDKPTPVSALVTVTDRVLRHMTRPFKTVNLNTAIPESQVTQIVGHIRRPQAILFDTKIKQIVYVVSIEGESRLAVLPADINYKIDGIISQSIRTGGLVDRTTLTDSKRYEVLSGKL